MQIVRISFFFLLNNIYSIVCICHIFFSHSFADGHFDWFCILGIVKSAAINVMVQISPWFNLFRFLDVYQVVGLLDCIQSLHLFFYESSKVFHSCFTKISPFYILACRCYSLSLISSLSNRGQMVCHCGLDLYFLDWWWSWVIFYVCLSFVFVLLHT